MMAFSALAIAGMLRRKTRFRNKNSHPFPNRRADTTQNLPKPTRKNSPTLAEKSWT